MIAMDAASHPYPAMLLDQPGATRAARLAADGAPVVPLPPAPGGAAGPCAPAPSVRQPGTHLAPHLAGRVAPARPLTDVAVLSRVVTGLRKPPAAEQRAILRLAEIVLAAGRDAVPPCGPYCADCEAAGSGCCDACERAGRKAAALYRLHDLILCAGTYAAAVTLIAQTDFTVLTEGRG